MSHDHEAVQVAMASLDSKLTPDEQRRSRQASRPRAECAAIAASHREIQRLLERLPPTTRPQSPPARIAHYARATAQPAMAGPRWRPRCSGCCSRRAPPRSVRSESIRSTPSRMWRQPRRPRSARPSPRHRRPRCRTPSPSPLAPGISDPTAGEQLLLDRTPPDSKRLVQSRTTASDTAVAGDVASSTALSAIRGDRDALSCSPRPPSCAPGRRPGGGEEPLGRQRQLPHREG